MKSIFIPLEVIDFPSPTTGVMVMGKRQLIFGSIDTLVLGSSDMTRLLKG
ncbi:hypothetical protein HS121_17975 [bacterium]|nr:hypothetical protein [bacterium]